MNPVINILKIHSKMGIIKLILEILHKQKQISDLLKDTHNDIDEAEKAKEKLIIRRATEDKISLNLEKYDSTNIRGYTSEQKKNNNMEGRSINCKIY